MCLILKYFKLVSFLVITLLSKNILATSYYVKPDGNDGADGKSHAAAWKTIGKVNAHAFKTGDDVYFLAGGSWKLERLVIDWSGAATNRVIVGAYYMFNGQETPGVPSGTGKPRIIGSYTGKCPGEIGSCIDTSTAVPAGVWTGLVGISGNYVTLRNMRVQNSAGRGIVVNNDYSYAILENNEVYYTAANSTLFNRGSSHNILRNNDTSYCAMGWKHGDWKKIANHWPTCNSAVRSNYNIFEGNYVHESYGEGIVMLKDAQYNIIRGNKIVAVRSANIYLDNSSNNIVENNILIGDRDGEFTHGRSRADGHRYGGGIAVRVEGYKRTSDAVNNVVRNNILVRTGPCLSMGLIKKAKKSKSKIGVKFIHNTCVEPRSYISLLSKSRAYANTLIANNIFVGSPQGETSCKIRPNANVLLVHNHWSEKQIDKRCKEEVGGIIGDPKLSRVDWANVGIRFIPDIGDFVLGPGSSAHKAGKNIQDNTYNGQFLQAGQLVTKCGNSHPGGSYDFTCRQRSNPPDIGAISK